MNHVEAGRFGGAVTAIKLKAEKNERVNTFNKKCQCCNGLIPYAARRNKYCSHRCSALKNNPGHVKRRANCVVCQLPVARGSTRFCSLKCHKELEYKIRVERWLAGLEPGVSRGGLIRACVRRYMLELRGNKCEKCGWAEINPKTGKVPVTIHHVDGKWQNTYPENLEVLCPNCHSLTPTFQGLNRGNGRLSRRQGYSSAKAA